MTTTILADEAERLVVVGPLRIEGWLEEPPCPVCRGPRIYWAAYDATFCPQCNEWLELRCRDPLCDSCRLRPEVPLSSAPAGPGFRGAA